MPTPAYQRRKVLADRGPALNTLGEYLPLSPNLPCSIAAEGFLDPPQFRAREGLLARSSFHPTNPPACYL